MMETPGTALVTGGAKRIGAAIARKLAAEGFAVAVHYRHSAESANRLVDEITGAGGKAAAVSADLEKSEDVHRLVPEAETALGPVMLLVNNASVFQDDCIATFDLEQFERHFAVHVKAPSILAQAMAKALPAETDGLIINMIDQRVMALTPRFYTYTLSKSALWTATQTMAQALAPQIRVNAIGPGPTLRNERQSEQDFKEQIDGLILKSGPGLDDFGRTILWLWQTRSVTGQFIALDGGQHLAWETPDITGIKE